MITQLYLFIPLIIMSKITQLNINIYKIYTNGLDAFNILQQTYVRSTK